ncbi:MAG: glycosyltransferase family 2 protein [Desulfomicrobium escambiense]|nr:glycosyltransferase family 2 protein [Desulfomicrobium escambiense]
MNEGIMSLISVVTPCYNEENNVKEFYNCIKSIFDNLPEYRYEHIFIDNCSTDKTIDMLKDIASGDPNVKVIINSRNFGPVRSPFYGLIQANGDAAILIACDFREPPSLIPRFIEKWKENYNIVLGVRNKDSKNTILTKIKKIIIF